MRICFVSHHAGLYGAEGALVELMESLRIQGIECYVLVPYQGPLIQELERKGFTASYVPYKWWVDHYPGTFKRIAKTLWNLFMTIVVARKIRQWDCDVVYTNTVTVNSGAIASKLLNLPHVWHIHEYGREHHGLYFDLGDKFSYWIINKLSSCIVFNSNAVKEKYQHYLHRDKLKVVYQSVTLSEIAEQKILLRTIKEKRLRCALVGRLQSGKKQEDAVHAVAALHKRKIDIDLVIIGSGDRDYERYLRELTALENIEDLVHFTGYIKNAFSYMLSMDIILVCSQYEAFGRVTVEAMLAGKPVIGARSGGTVELIKEGINGLLYNPGEYNDLTEKLEYLYNNKSIAIQMGQRGKELVRDRFTQERYGQEISVILKDVCTNK